MRGLHRSWLFWLGQPGLIFIGWAWSSSLRSPTSGVYSSNRIFAGFLNQAGTTTLGYIYPGDPFMEGYQIDFRPLPPSTFPPGLPTAIKKTELPVFADHGAPDPTAQVTFAYWFLLLCYLVPWSAAIYWRQQRRKKATQA